MSISKSIVLTVAVLSILATKSVNAQSSYSEGISGFHHHAPIRYCGDRYLGYRGVGYGITAHGLADLLRARAEGNLTNAQAASQSEVARTQRLENDVFALQTRLERKRINKTSRFGHLHARADELAQMNLANAISVDPIVDSKRLRPNEVDARNGKLAWPLLLAMSHFDNARKPIDCVFAARAEAGSLHPDDYLPLLDLIDQLMEDLQINAAILPREDLVEAQNFLRRMKSEARLPAPGSSLGVQLVSREQ